MESNALQQRMADTYGVSDPEVVRAVERAGYSAATLEVLRAAPLLEVAWADGHVSDGERLSILERAVEMGIEGGPAYERLLDLLRCRPPRHFFDNSRKAMRSALRAVSPAEGLAIRRRLLSYCAQIASASRSAVGRLIAINERRAIRRISHELTPASVPPAAVGQMPRSVA